MEFALDSLHDLEKEIDGVLTSVTEAAKCGTLKNLNKGHFGKCNKDVVTNLILHLASVLDKSCSVMRSASAKIDNLKTEQIENQKRVVLLQEEVIKSKGEQVQEVQAAVKTEFKSFSDVVKQNVQEVPSKKLAAAFKTAVVDDQRSRCIILFGIEENKTQVLTDTVNRVLGAVFDGEKPSVKECYRVGAEKPGVARPVRICFSSSGLATTALHNSKKLKECSEFRKVYLSPDRSPDERAARRLLVETLRTKMKEEPQFYHFIRDGKLCKTDRKVTEMPAQPASSNSSTALSAQSTTFSTSATTSASDLNSAHDLNLSSFQRSVRTAKNRSSLP